MIIEFTCLGDSDDTITLEYLDKEFKFLSYENGDQVHSVYIEPKKVKELATFLIDVLDVLEDTEDDV